MSCRQPNRNPPEVAARLYAENQGLVRWVINECFHGSGDYELFGVGLGALHRAAEMYDASLGHKFSTYARSAVFNEIRRHVRKNSRQSTLHLSWKHDIGRMDPDAIELGEIQRHEAFVENAAQRLLASIDGRHLAIVKRRMAGESMVSIGRSLGVCKERVSQLYQRALELMRQRCWQTGMRYRESLARLG